eukprot:Awhi_evm1s3297
MDSDWDHQIIIRKKPQRAADARSSKNVNEAKRSGGVDTSKKFNAGGNKQRAGGSNAALIEDSDELKVKKVNPTASKAIQQARNAKGMTQKDLATKINEKPTVVTDYENGRGIPDQQILGKMERALGVKLRGKDIGQPLPTRAPKKK